MKNIKTKNQSNNANVLLYAGFNHLMTFGKHKGKLLGWIAENAPQYIVWMADNEVMKIEPPIVKQCREDAEDEWDDLMDAAAAYNAEDWECRD